MELQTSPETTTTGKPATRFNLGSFEGFNFRSQSAIERILLADDVIRWDHDVQGEAEFWPAGDRPEVAWLFSDRGEVTASELLALHRLLVELGDDSLESFLKIHHALNVCASRLCALKAGQVEDLDVQIFVGSNFCDLRREVAYELFELYYPEAYAVWEKCSCDGLVFDTDRFLYSPSLSVDEVTIGDVVALIVAP